MTRANRLRHLRAPRRNLRITMPLGVATYFLWVVPAALLPAAFTGVGAPHLLFTNEYEQHGNERFYLSCTYAGPSGLRPVQPLDGTCPILKMLAGTN